MARDMHDAGSGQRTGNQSAVQIIEWQLVGEVPRGGGLPRQTRSYAPHIVGAQRCKIELRGGHDELLARGRSHCPSGAAQLRTCMGDHCCAEISELPRAVDTTMTAEDPVHQSGPGAGQANDEYGLWSRSRLRHPCVRFAREGCAQPLDGIEINLWVILQELSPQL